MTDQTPTPRDDGGPAFARIGEWDERRCEWAQESQSGMTLRDYFAAKALIGAMSGAQGLGDASKQDRSRLLDGLAAILYEVADAMIAARSR